MKTANIIKRNVNMSMEKLKFDNPVASKPRPAPHQRAEMINQLLEFMGEKNFKKWLGLTRHLSPSGIYSLMSQAKEGKKPQALFNYLLKKTR